MAGKRKNSEMNQEAKSAVEQILKGYVVDKISEEKLYKSLKRKICQKSKRK